MLLIVNENDKTKLRKIKSYFMNF